MMDVLLTIYVIGMVVMGVGSLLGLFFYIAYDIVRRTNHLDGAIFLLSFCMILTPLWPFMLVLLVLAIIFRPEEFEPPMWPIVLSWMGVKRIPKALRFVIEQFKFAFGKEE